jgi:hypothetical protein
MKCEPCDVFGALVDAGPFPKDSVCQVVSKEMVDQLHKAYSKLFSYLRYAKLDLFCTSLIDLIELSNLARGSPPRGQDRAVRGL